MKKFLLLAAALLAMGANAQNVIYENSFESDEDLQTLGLIDLDGDGTSWTFFNGAADYAHSGEGIAVSWSYYNNQGAVDADNWLLLPELALGPGAKFEFFCKAMDADFPDNFSVVLTENPEFTTTDDFVTLYSGVCPADYGEGIQIDLSNYEGKTVILGIRHADYDKYWMLLDDLKVTDNSTSVAISDVRVDAEQSNVWYDLQGHKYNEKPAAAGLYINNGKKVLVK